MSGYQTIVLLVTWAIGAGFSHATAQAMPSSISGIWKIVKVIPTHNTACWDADRARTLVGSTPHYQQKALTWQGGRVAIIEALNRKLSDREFQQDYRVSLTELGIHAPGAQQIHLQHEAANVTGTTTEVPGDTILLAGPGRIIVSACGVFYSAVRVPSKVKSVPR